MSNLPQELREKVDKLERNFAVSSVIFKKFGPIFLDIFRNPADDPPKAPRSRKQKRLPCSVSEVFNFAWTMFIQVKGNFRAISDDLVNSYHLLLCCIDWIYVNALLSNRRDLLNPTFSGLPENFESKDYKPPTEAPCLIQLLCEKHDGVLIEAKGIKEHWWKPHIKKQFDRKVLKGKNENLTGILELGHFEVNSKEITHRYEEYVLNVGDFDERVFLDRNADAEIGTPAKQGAFSTGDLQEQVFKKSLRQTIVENSRLAPSTPLTGRRYLSDKNEDAFTPVTTATQSVHRLQALLSGLKVGPSEALLEMCNECSKNPKDELLERMKEMSELFCKQYSAPTTEDVPHALDFAKKRLQLAESLYYKELEQIMLTEKRRFQSKDPKHCDLSGIMGQDMFHRALIACCIEVVIYSYNSQRTFPWIVDIFNIDAFFFYKVIELVIRGEEGLSRDVVKHLSFIEECILETLAWKSGSPLWEVVEQWKKDHEGVLPSVEDVHFPSQIERDGMMSAPASAFNSPIQHPAVKRIAGDKQASLLKKDLLQSPTGPSAADFLSPIAGTGNAKRRLFDDKSNSSSTTSTPPTTPGSSSESNYGLMKTIATFKLAQGEDGKQVLVPMQVVSMPRHARLEKKSENSPDTHMKPITPPSSDCIKPKRTGSFALFLRKLYHLASVRLQELCDKLEIDSELHRQIWTGLEYILMHHIDLLMDRHIDQLIMGAIYVMGKVTRKEHSFQDIMRCYRLQPQAQSHVYRSILLSKRQRRTSADSTSSKHSSESAESGKDKTDKTKNSNIRSNSTLPVMPNSAPPTPTRMAGTDSLFQFEDRGEQRGDLIHFYNAIFVDRIKEFSLRFATEEVSDMPILSPLPLARCQQQSPRRISNRHSVFVSHHETRDGNLTPTTKLLYCFNRSPATDLRAINNMLRMNERGQQASKRILVDSESSTSKKLCLSNDSPMFQKKLQAVFNERKATNGIDG